MPESVLAILKLVFLAALYLFLARIVRAVWVEIFAERRTVVDAETNSPTSSRAAGAPTQAPEAAKSRREKRAERKAAANTLVLRVVEPPDLRGQSFQVQDEMTIGRAAGCAIVVNDTFASQLHARIFRRDGSIFIEDLGSTNGTYLNRKQVHGPVPIQARDRVQVANVVLELQT
jgi:pSer/pThr/pTyr-binding forkhead associated (FHA) protein